MFFIFLLRRNVVSLLRQGKQSSESAWSGMWGCGVVCRIATLDTYIMTCTGMKNHNGKQNHLELERKIIHHGKPIEHLKICFVENRWQSIWRFFFLFLIFKEMFLSGLAVDPSEALNIPWMEKFRSQRSGETNLECCFFTGAICCWVWKLTFFVKNIFG